MKRLLIACVLLPLFTHCKKEKDHSPVSPQPLTLLTNSEWLLLAFGFDDDHSGNIEPSEDMSIECQRDNTTRYYTNGSGKIFENQLVCGNDSISSFNWKFIDNEQAIEVAGVRMDLQKLTDDTLHLLLHEPALKDPLLLMYRKKH